MKIRNYLLRYLSQFIRVNQHRVGAYARHTEGIFFAALEVIKQETLGCAIASSPHTGIGNGCRGNLKHRSIKMLW